MWRLPGGDLPATKGFYAQAFGWTLHRLRPDLRRLRRGRSTAASTPTPRTGAEPLVVLFADDLEAMEAKVRAAGGEIIRPIFGFPGGRRFHFRDPSGNELAVWSAT